MELTIYAAYPAGNTTVLVETPVAQKDYADVAAKLMALPRLHAEQVGFLTAPKKGGKVRLEMMGGEFCGNALRCAALWWICTKSASGGHQVVPVEISGCDDVLPVEYDPVSGDLTADMPLPEKIEYLSARGETLAAVCFDGIVHLIAHKPDDWMTLEEVKELLRGAAKHFGKAAAGLLLCDPEWTTLHPAVYVAATDSLVCENSCASGSAAVAAAACAGKPDGEYALELAQPGGKLRTKAIVSNGKLTSLRLGGIAALTDELQAII